MHTSKDSYKVNFWGFPLVEKKIIRMDRLNGPANLMIVSDLDFTMVCIIILIVICLWSDAWVKSGEVCLCHCR